MQTIDFLMSVWSEQPDGYVCLSSKGAKWSDYSFKKDAQLRPKLEKWFDQQQGKDVYFCPLTFSQPKRRQEFAQPSKFLWGDIDEGSPDKFPPSVLWESSPGRFAGLWRMNRQMSANNGAELSRRIAYHIGGDRGGWDVTQVLRIPGTPNLKYKEKPIVRLRHFHDDSYAPHQIPRDALDKWRKTIPRALLNTLEGPATGDRSEMLWKLENELVELGIPAKEVIEILRGTAWNKFAGRPDEEERLKAELDKIAPKETVHEGFRVETFYQVVSSLAGDPGWLVDGFWQRASHGIIAGEPKSFKSTLIMDMLHAVACGDARFLGQRVHHSGPVLVVQNENPDHIMRDRFSKYHISRGLGDISVGRRSGRYRKMHISWPREVPMMFINQQGFTLDNPQHLEDLESLIAREKPVALLLDPLYLMFSGDINSAKELQPALQWCLYIKQTYHCAVILVHHYGKGTAGQRGGQRMLGSTTLHGWVDSAWYLQVQEGGIVRLDREFRGAQRPEMIDVHMRIGEFGSAGYMAYPSDVGELPREVIDIVREHGRLSEEELMSISGMSKWNIRHWLKGSQAVFKGGYYEHG